MKIAVISDIHANLIALQEVLKDVKKENCDEIFCLGDLVLAGPQPKETLDFIKEQEWTIIQGNTDKRIADFDDDIFKYMQQSFPIMANSIVEDIKVVDKEYLSLLPPKEERNIEGVNVLLVHGSPRYNNEDIAPGMPVETIEKIINGTTADLILCGHTHVPCGYQTKTKQTVVNVGSVGRPMTP